MFKKPKVLLLFSGGLDSRLAAKILQEQKIEIEAVFFMLPFGGGCCNNFECVFNYSQINGLKFHVIDVTKPPLLKRYIKLVKFPKYGYGVSMNPCKDCRIFMLKLAKKLAKQINASIIATGEVLGQRPMSQKQKDFCLIEKMSGLENRILRPLSAKLLAPTLYEKEKMINREKLLNIKGRSRKEQINLAKRYGIKFPNPGGGCLLCEKNYAPKLKDLLKNKPLETIKYEDVLLINVGRHFRNNGKIILGRNEQENKQIENIGKILNHNLFIPKKPGPSAIFENKEDYRITELLVKAYSKNSDSNMRREFFKDYQISQI